MDPPLRSEFDRFEILEGLRDGTLTIIASDHAPHTNSEKNVPFKDAPSGIIGLETSLALGVTHLVRKGHLTMRKLIEKMSTNPAKLYNLDAGYLSEGCHANIVIFSEIESFIVKDFLSKSSNTPFLGQRLYGKVKYTICEGEIVYSNN